MNAEKKPRRLGEILIDEGVITKDQLNIALTEQKKVHEPIGKILVGLGFAAVKNATEKQFNDIENALKRQEDPDISDEAFCQADVAFHRALVDASGNGMLRFVMYTVIEALVPVTNMVVTVVRDRGEILSLHRQMLIHLRQRNNTRLIESMNTLMEYLLEQFELASQL